MSNAPKPFAWFPGNEDHDWKWDKYFMGIALLSEMRSKDDDRQVGACVVNDEPRVIGIGYNGMPLNCHDSLMQWKAVSEKNGKKLKHNYVCHAELNAIVNKNPKSVKGCTIYVTLFPCNECAKIIVRSGIKRVVYLSDDKNKSEFQASKHILDSKPGIECEKFDQPFSDELREKVVTIDFNGALEPGAKWEKNYKKKIISWEQYFMGLAILSGKVRSDYCEEGACAVDENKRIVGLGYVQKIVDPPTQEMAETLKNAASEKERREDQKDVTEKFFYVSHAPVNAIVTESPSSLQGCTMYVVQYPCNECAKVIVQSGIQRIIYLKKKNESDSSDATTRMFAIAHVKEEQYKEEPKTGMLSVDFTPAPRKE